MGETVGNPTGNVSIPIDKTLCKTQAQNPAAFDQDAEGKPKAKQGSQRPSWLINHTKPKPKD